MEAPHALDAASYQLHCGRRLQSAGASAAAAAGHARRQGLLYTVQPRVKDFHMPDLTTVLF